MTIKRRKPPLCGYSFFFIFFLAKPKNSMLESSHAKAKGQGNNHLGENPMKPTVKQNLLKVNLKAKNYKLAVKLALQIEVEQGDLVYLENAYNLVSHGMNKNQFAGYLAALAKDGFYHKQDEHFGRIEV